MTDEIIIKRGDEEVVLTEGRIRDLTSKFIEACGNEATIHDDFGMNSKMVDMLINIKKTWYPATQKNVNMNVEGFDNKLKLWLNARKEMAKEQAEGLVIIEEVPGK